MALVAGFGSTSAVAAEVTDMAPELGVVGGLRYTGRRLWGGLVEDGLLVGERRVARDDLDLLAELSPVEGVALTLDLRFTPSYRVSYPSARAMVIEPFDGSGSYLAGAELDPTPELRAGGVEGLWVGVAAAPYSEAYGLGHRMSARFDLAIRTPSPNRNLWTARDGRRGPSPGGTALRVAGAFSTERGSGNPWLRAEWLLENPVTVTVVDEAGQIWATDLPLRPASTLMAESGIEIVAFRQAPNRVATDLWLGVGYRSWEDIASGVWLPSVLDSSRTIAVTSGDTILGRAGLAVDVHATEHTRSRLGVVFDYALPYRLENVYPVTTSPNTFQVSAVVDLRGIASLAKAED